MAEMTPMMRQYLEMKEKHPDSILFFRLGDFYEMFNEDAKLASKELDLTLTTRDRNKPEEERTPMCGVPLAGASLGCIWVPGGSAPYDPRMAAGYPAG